MYTVENPGEGVAQIFAKIPRGTGVKAVWAKHQGGTPFFENLHVRVLSIPPFHPHSLCSSMIKPSARFPLRVSFISLQELNL